MSVRVKAFKAAFYNGHRIRIGQVISVDNPASVKNFALPFDGGKANKFDAEAAKVAAERIAAEKFAGADRELTSREHAAANAAAGSSDAEGDAGAGDGNALV